MCFRHNIWEGAIIGLVSLFYSLIMWTREAKIEGILGFHTPWVKEGLKLSFLLFIFREVMVFVRFFWAFFDGSLSPSIEGGWTWPPYGVTPINPFGIPMLNTRLLLFRRIMLTWAHQGFYRGENIEFKLWGTLFIGAFFMVLQFVEYHNRRFTLRRGIYGSTFYCLTGLHGCHVFIGGVFILIFILGYRAGTYSTLQRIWLELSSLYWHFVDVVWFFVWGFLYIWGS